MFYDVWELGLLRIQTYQFVSFCGARSYVVQASLKLSIAEDDLQLILLPLPPAKGWDVQWEPHAWHTFCQHLKLSSLCFSKSNSS